MAPAPRTTTEFISVNLYSCIPACYNRGFSLVTVITDSILSHLGLEYFLPMDRAGFLKQVCTYVLQEKIWIKMAMRKFNEFI